MDSLKGVEFFKFVSECVDFADCVRAGAGRCRQETEVGLQAGAGGGLHESGELRTALPRVHWEETPIRNRAVPERRPVHLYPPPPNPLLLLPHLLIV